ncbi:MAG: hypothetical protein ACI35O_03255 [Bacillaceae bacterium]
MVENNTKTATEEKSKQYWQISAFAQQVGVHFNSIYTWFNRLENERIHFISRVGGNNERVYDNLDLEIAKYIKKKRDDKWSLNAIFDELPNVFELRPFPSDFHDDSKPGELTPEKVEEVMGEIVEKQMKIIKDQYEAQLKNLQNYYESQIETTKQELINQLPAPKSKEEERKEKYERELLIFRVNMRLKDEALQKWESKPEGERKKRVGVFFKQDNYDAKEKFVNDYINANIEKALKESFDMDE